MTDLGMDTSLHLKRGALQEYATAGWSMLGAAAALVVAVASDSMALTGFGLDAVLRAVFAGLTAWQLQYPSHGQARTDDYAVYERRASFVIGVLFFLLALYMLNESGSRLYYGQRPTPIVAALVVSAVISLIACALAAMKYRFARRMENRTARAGAMMSVYGAYVSLVLLLGVSVHAGREWWWADPAAALLMLPGIVRSGWEAVEQSKRSP